MEKNNDTGKTKNSTFGPIQTQSNGFDESVAGVSKEPKTTQRSHKKYTKTVLFGFVIIGVFSYFVYKNYQAYSLSYKSNEITTSENQLPTVQNDYQTDFETYTSKKLGFKISHPSNLKPVEVDVREQQRQYNKDCETGVLQGCGGLRWPDYKVEFLNSNSKSVFSIEIHVIPVGRYLIGEPSLDIEFGGISPAIKSDSNLNSQFLTYGVNKDGFSYIFQGRVPEGASISYLESIASTFQLIEPEKPLACLWFDEFIGSDPDNDESHYASFNGYFYNNKTNNCQKTNIYVWKDEDTSSEEYANIPFQTMADCTSACVVKP